MKRLSRSEIAKAVRMYFNGASAADIAKSVGAPKATVCGALNQSADFDIEPPDAIDIEGYRLSPDAALRLLEIKKRAVENQA